MDVCALLFCVYVVLCLQVAALQQADPRSKKSYRLYMDEETEIGQGPQATEPQANYE
jgi:hypothetical protein